MATAQVIADQCTIWAPTQSPGGAQATGARLTGLPPAKVIVHTTLLGGGFGRRGNQDFVIDAVEVAKTTKGVPVKVMWTREDDIRGGKYRPLYVHRLRAGLDASGAIVAWEQRIVGQSILGGTPFEAAMVKDGIDPTSVEGVTSTQ